jgi:hypothetical protein
MIFGEKFLHAHDFFFVSIIIPCVPEVFPRSQKSPQNIATGKIATAGRIFPVAIFLGINYFADLRMTFRQNFFSLQDWFRNKLGVGLG